MQGAPMEAMAGKNSVYFLIQWEDRFLSVIRSNDVVEPKEEECHYREGQLITAKYGQHTYEAVICEIHADKKLLEKRAALPPKYSYDVVKDKTKGVKESMGQEVTEVKAPEPTKQSTKVKTPEPTNRTTDVTSKTPEPTKQVTEEKTEPTKQVSEVIMPEPTKQVTEVKTPEPTKRLTDVTTPEPTKEAAACSAVENKKSDSSSSKRKSDTDDGLAQLKEDVQRLRRKQRRLEERIAELESKKVTAEDGETEKMSKLVEHMAEIDVQSVLTTLAKAIFTEENLINCSRTGKKTSKCTGAPRPPLDQKKLVLLETAVRKKTNISKEIFIKKFENLQKTLRQKNK